MSYRNLSSHYLLFLYLKPDVVSIIHGSKAVVSWEPTASLFIFCWLCTQLLPSASSLYHFVLHDGLCCTSLLCSCKTQPRERCHAPQQGRRALEGCVTGQENGELELTAINAKAEKDEPCARSKQEIEHKRWLCW